MTYRTLINILLSQLVLRCYENYPKVYARLGPGAKNGGLEILLEKVNHMREMIEEVLTNHVKISLPRYDAVIELNHWLK